MFFSEWSILWENWSGGHNFVFSALPRPNQACLVGSSRQSCGKLCSLDIDLTVVPAAAHRDPDLLFQQQDWKNC